MFSTCSGQDSLLPITLAMGSLRWPSIKRNTKITRLWLVCIKKLTLEWKPQTENENWEVDVLDW